MNLFRQPVLERDVRTFVAKLLEFIYNPILSSDIKMLDIHNLSFGTCLCVCVVCACVCV